MFLGLDSMRRFFLERMYDPKFFSKLHGINYPKRIATVG